MVGPYNVSMKCSNGKVISGYIAASAAAGTYLPTDTNGKATSTSPAGGFFVPETVEIVDIWTDCPSGEFTILSNGQPTNVFVDCAVQQATANMRTAPRFGLVAGRQYLLKVTSAMAA